MRRRLQASMILALCTAVASFSAERRKPALPIRPVTDATAVETSRRKRRRTGSTPMIDSDLLRFLNTQKMVRQQEQLQQQQPEELAKNKVAAQQAAFTDETNLPAPPQQQQQQLGDKDLRIRTNPTNLATETAIPTGSESAAASSADTITTAVKIESLWLSQYTRNRVVSLLLDRHANSNIRAATNAATNNSPDTGQVLALDGTTTPTKSVDPVLVACIETAGERVQSQTLARMARRRVREFLKQRESVWSATTGSSTSSSSSSSDAPKPPTTTTVQHNNFEQVVDLLLEYGLNVKDVAEILIHTPGIALMQARTTTAEDDDTMTDNDTRITTNNTRQQQQDQGETLQQTLDRVLVQLLTGTLQLRRYDARKILRQTPGLLTRRGSKSAYDLLQLLQQLGVSTNSLSRADQINSLPTLLSRSPAAVFRLVAFLSSDAVRMPVNQIGPLLRRSESQQLLNAVAPVPVRKRVSYRRRPDQNGMNTNGFSENDMENNSNDNNDEYDDILDSLLYGRSSELRRNRINDIYRNMTETAWTLRHEIGTADLGKVIAAYPAVLLLDAQETILPTASYLMNDLGIWQDDLPRVLQLYPVLLGKPVEEMRKIESYLLSLEVPRDNLASIFRSFPALLTMDIKTQMVPVVEFLRNEIGITNVGRFVSRLPPVLGYSITHELRPKWEFLQNGVTTDPRFAVSKFPAYFSYPLEGVIKTRFLYLSHVRRIPTSLVALDRIVRGGDKDFSILVARDRDDGVAFAQFAAKRQVMLLKGRNQQQRQRKLATKRQRPIAPSSVSA